MSKILFACFLFFNVCISSFPNEIELTIQHMMEIVNDLKVNFSILNTTKGCEFEISERINNDFEIMDEFIENITDKLCKNQTIHISLPLAIEIKNIINSRKYNTCDIGTKSFFGAFQNFEDLNFLFDLLNDLKWILANFPLFDTNAWVIEPDLNVSYNRIKESINILEEIQDIYFCNIFKISKNIICTSFTRG
ncbi:hypothetical protein AGMMS49579_19540 [Spirochaetia bacterium]|nr:hypothetical protein AGMMS49579_19540 [Spirochaetia bacterium]